MCKHFTGGKGSFTCKAFPKGIPFEILSEYILHYNKIENQKGAFVYESFNAKNVIDTSAQRIDRIKKDIEIYLLRIIRDNKIDESKISFTSYYLQFKNRSRFFWKRFRKETIYVINKDKTIIELEIEITSDFIKNAYELLLIENVLNQQSTMYMNLYQNNSLKIYFDIDYSHSFLRSSYEKRGHRFLRKEKEYEDIKKSDLFDGFESIKESEKIRIVNEILENAENSLTIKTYKIFLHFYVRRLLITPRDINIIRRNKVNG